MINIKLRGQSTVVLCLDVHSSNHKPYIYSFYGRFAYGRLLPYLKVHLQTAICDTKPRTAPRQKGCIRITIQYHPKSC